MSDEFSTSKDPSGEPRFFSDSSGSDENTESANLLPLPDQGDDKSFKKERTGPSPMPTFGKMHHRIGIIGGQRTGKTAYLYMLGKLIKDHSNHIGGWSIGAYSDDYQIFYQKISEQLDNYQRTPFSDLDVFELFEVQKGRNKINVTAFNAAGENFDAAIHPGKFKKIRENTERHTKVRRLRAELINCEAFIFLIDAEQSFPEFRHEEDSNALSPDDLLFSFRNFIRKEFQLEPESLIDKPTAFVLTKADYLPRDNQFISPQNLSGIQKANIIGFIRDYFEEVFNITQEFAVKSFHAISCWKPTFILREDGKEKEIDRHTLNKLKRGGEASEVIIAIKDPKSINIQNPMIFVLDALAQTMEIKRKKKRLKSLIVVVITLLTLIFYPFASFWAGNVFNGIDNLRISGVLYKIAGYHPVFKQTVLEKSLRSKILEISNKAIRTGNYDLAFSHTQYLEHLADNLQEGIDKTSLETGIIKQWLIISTGFLSVDRFEKALQSLAHAAQYNSKDSLIEDMKIKAILSLAGVSYKNKNYGQAFDLIKPVFLDTLVADDQTPLSQRIKQATMQIIQEFIGQEMDKKNYLSTLSALDFADKHGLVANRNDLMEKYYACYFDMAQKDISAYRTKVKENHKNFGLVNENDPLIKGFVTNIDKALTYSMVKEPVYMLQCLKLIRENRVVMGRNMTMELLKSAGGIHRLAHHSKELVAGTMIDLGEKDFEAGNDEKGFEYLSMVLEIPEMPESGKEICEVITAHIKQLDDMEKFKFIDMAQAILGHQSVGAGMLITDIEADIVVNIADEYLKAGNVKAALELMDLHRSRLAGNSRFNKYYNHAAKAKDMILVKGVGGVRSFYMDPYEVSNREYASFLKRNAGDRPKYWGQDRYLRKSGKPDSPVIHVTWDKAKRFARYLGKRLPTVREWELAWGKHVFPWGKDYKKTNFNHRDSQLLCAVDRSNHLAKNDVGSNKIYCLAGNVREFTSNSLYDEENRERVILKGGSFSYHANRISKTASNTMLTHLEQDDTGFRCALSLTP